ncbi:MAG: glycosyltransferase family 2 protein [Verrucomicrobia bacterium]|nr:glycosyltransferase family 2 protein [Verrucomicrobiota bacterium]
MPLLTIAIPSFNRNEILRQNLAVLLPQLADDCRLLILDNHCEVPLETTLAPLLRQLKPGQSQIVRHPVNIGGNANILRCFELCETEWLWILGDDDRTAPNAIATVLSAIRLHPTAGLLNFTYCGFQREGAFETRGLNDLVARLDSFGMLNFTSCCVYRVPPLASHLRFGYQYGIYATAPHTATFLASMTPETQVCFRTESIIDAIELAPELWRLYGPMLGIITLLEIPLPPGVRQILHQKAFYHFEPLTLLLYLLSEFPDSPKGNEQVGYTYCQIVNRNYGFLPSARDRWVGWALLPLARHPSLTRRLHAGWLTLKHRLRSPRAKTAAHPSMTDHSARL